MKRNKFWREVRRMSMTDMWRLTIFEFTFMLVFLPILSFDLAINEDFYNSFKGQTLEGKR